MKKEIPSQNTQYYWIYAEAPNYFQVDRTGDVGKWLVFTSIEKIDEIWDCILWQLHKIILANYTANMMFFFFALPKKEAKNASQKKLALLKQFFDRPSRP